MNRAYYNIFDSFNFLIVLSFFNLKLFIIFTFSTTKLIPIFLLFIIKLFITNYFSCFTVK